jgi:hypothetical protein
MKTLSLKLDKEVFQETEALCEMVNKPRNRYINEALVFYNRFQKNKILEKRLEEESKMVSDESMRVLSEFENMDDHEG